MYNDYFDNLDGTDEKKMSTFNNFLVEVGNRIRFISLEKTKTYAKIFTIISILMGLLVLFNTTMSNVIGILTIFFSWIISWIFLHIST